MSNQKTNEQEIYVIVCKNDKPHPTIGGIDPMGEIVMEQYVKLASRKEVERRAEVLFSRYGECRIGRIVFDD